MTDPLHLAAAAVAGILIGVVIVTLFGRRLGKDLARNERDIAGLRNELNT